MGRGLGKKGSLGRELKWENRGYRGSRGSVEGRRKMAPEVGFEHKMAAARPGMENGGGEREVLEAILSFFNSLFSSVILRILFCSEAVLDSYDHIWKLQNAS